MSCRFSSLVVPICVVFIAGCGQSTQDRWAKAFQLSDKAAEESKQLSECMATSIRDGAAFDIGLIDGRTGVDPATGKGRDEKDIQGNPTVFAIVRDTLAVHCGAVLSDWLNRNSSLSIEDAERLLDPARFHSFSLGHAAYVFGNGLASNKQYQLGFTQGKAELTAKEEATAREKATREKAVMDASEERAKQLLKYAVNPTAEAPRQ